MQIDRVLQEHSQRSKLARFGYHSKTKLLFWGPPGCGKTLTAHSIANELGLPLGIVRLNTLITSFLGETASHIQRVFDLARSTPMVLLIDEADAIAKDRDDGNDVGELKRVVNSLLQAMDAFQPDDSIVIAASNHQYLLDEALWRRFDDVVVFPMPSATQLKSFISVLLNGVKVSGSLDSVVPSIAGLSFAQAEKGIIEVIKTMILDNRPELCTSEITNHFKKYRSSIRSAGVVASARPEGARRMNDGFPPFVLSPPESRPRRKEDGRTVPLSPEILAKRQQIAQVLKVKINQLSQHLKSMSDDERRAVFYKLEHEAPVNPTTTLSGTDSSQLHNLHQKSFMPCPSETHSTVC